MHSSAIRQELTPQLQKSIRAWLPEVIELARRAGQTILKIYETDFHVNNKKDNTPVTCADLAANEVIVERLAQLTPGIPILSEESVEVPFSQRRLWDTYWLVDPLDGTRAFIERSGEFSVNIALVHNHQPIIGVIYSPVKQCCFYACRDHGAYHLDKDNVARNIRARSKCPDKIVVAGTRTSRSTALLAYLDNLQHAFDSVDIRFMGSSLKSCMVAEGEADLYVRLGPTSEWDTAAAQCIVEEAGGLITDTRMKPLSYNTRESLLNPNFFVFGDQSIRWEQFLND